MKIDSYVTADDVIVLNGANDGAGYPIQLSIADARALAADILASCDYAEAGCRRDTGPTQTEWEQGWIDAYPEALK
jgi:hypothetical protein